MADWERYFRDLVGGERTGAMDRLLLTALSAASLPYGAAMRLRAAAYRHGILPVRRLSRPVIAVGNLTVGGTGKTPMVMWLARFCLARGVRPCVLSRGYGGSAAGRVTVVTDGKTLVAGPEEAGDEPYLLASSVPGLSVVIGADRYRAGLLATERFSPDLFLLDDGYQHLRLARDLNILLLDASSPFGTGRTLPAGLLREPPAAADRADLVVLTRCEGGGGSPPLPAGVPVCRTRHTLTGAVPVGGGGAIPLTELPAGWGIAFAGIAHPPAFFDLLCACGVRVRGTLAFPDHTPYGEEEVAALCRLKEASGATFLITTEKDAVKLVPHLDRLGPVFAARLELEFADEAPLAGLVEKILQLRR